MIHDREEFFVKMEKMQRDIAMIIYKESDPRMILAALSYHMIKICTYNSDPSKAIENMVQTIREGYEIAKKAGISK